MCVARDFYLKNPNPPGAAHDPSGLVKQLLIWRDVCITKGKKQNEIRSAISVLEQRLPRCTGVGMS